MGHSKTARDLDRARLAGGVDQVGDHLDVVLGDRALPRAPGLAMVVRLAVGLELLRDVRFVRRLVLDSRRDLHGAHANENMPQLGSIDKSLP